MFKENSMFENECCSPVHSIERENLSHYALSVFYLYVTNKGKLFDFSRDSHLLFVNYDFFLKGAKKKKKKG